ncbi:zf-HC2 domain-containing protein [Clostridium sp. D2Q-11]|uniref:Zf-HC2 domain-containing protein n=1 Tax=Anaeromonas frigoriresistens TaxID=2683708 RepID=A0A942V426_9FIRM|nr:zf-HC2 domain-containing protein [Anaeromonas frigoriresistens]MBS4539537.1 zf-HC2 domain-containing protein [Anaeromonas frigoriresistens]
MDCKEASMLIMRSIDNDIKPSERAILDSHIQKCTKCSEEFNMLKMALDEMGDLDIIEPPEDIEDMVMMEIDKKRYKLRNKKVKKLVYVPIFISLLLIGHYIYLSFLADIIIEQDFIREIFVSVIVWSTNMIINYMPNIIRGLGRIIDLLNNIPIYFYILFSIWIVIASTTIVYGWNKLFRLRRN